MLLAVAAVAAHLGIANEDEINNMSIPFFNDVLAAIGKKLNFESVSNLYGNSFAKDSSKVVNEAYPLTKKKKNNSLVNSMKNVAIIKAPIPDKNGLTKAPSIFGGMVDWATGAV